MRLKKKTEEESKYLDIIARQSPDLLIIVDQQWRVAYMNKVLPGFNMEKVIGDDVLRQGLERMRKKSKSNSRPCSKNRLP